MSRMKDIYKAEVVPALVKKFGYSNVHMIPKIEKIVVNCVTKDAVSNSKVVFENRAKWGINQFVNSKQR